MRPACARGVLPRPRARAALQLRLRLRCRRRSSAARSRRAASSRSRCSCLLALASRLCDRAAPARAFSAATCSRVLALDTSRARSSTATRCSSRCCVLALRLLRRFAALGVPRAAAAGGSRARALPRALDLLSLDRGLIDDDALDRSAVAHGTRGRCRQPDTRRSAAATTATCSATDQQHGSLVLADEAHRQLRSAASRRLAPSTRPGPSGNRSSSAPACCSSTAPLTTRP